MPTTAMAVRCSTLAKIYDLARYYRTVNLCDAVEIALDTELAAIRAGKRKRVVLPHDFIDPPDNMSESGKTTNEP